MDDAGGVFVEVGRATANQSSDFGGKKEVRVCLGSWDTEFDRDPAQTAHAREGPVLEAT